MRRFTIIWAISFIVIAGCSDKTSTADKRAADFFYPPIAGTHFIYDLDSQASHVVAITKVAGAGDGKRYIELHERITNLPSLSSELEFRTDYILDDGADEVRRIRRHLGGEEELIIIKGPVKSGTEWEVRVLEVNTRKDRPGTKRDFRKCGLTEKLPLIVLGKERECVQVVCLNDEGLRKSRDSFCRGVGYVAHETMREGKWVKTETLIRIISAPDGTTL